MDIRWSAEKNAVLKQKFGCGFERMVVALSDGALWDDRRHQNLERYPHQRQLLVELDNYVWVIPYVLAAETVFFKTFFPSRKATTEYLRGDGHGR